jgi:hypothetical protein
MVGGAVEVTLPGGYRFDGGCFREARLRPIGSGDEGFLLDTEGRLLPAHRVTALLARCVERLGPAEPATAEAVRSLTVGDREALLLHLRRLSLGERLQGVVDCPDCGERMDLDLQVGDLLLPPYDHPGPSYEAEIPGNGASYRVRFRLPTGADQEDAAILARSDPHAAAERLLGRCVERVVDGEGKPIDGVPPKMAGPTSEAMSELDPQAELILSLTCPACSHAFLAPFDTAAYLFRELDERARHLHREVHLLAFYYHWSEAEIVGMPVEKRRMYLELLEEALAEEARR